MKTKLTLLLCLGTVFTSFGQSLLSNGGGELEANNIHLSFSIGELATATFEDDIILTQGFQQAELLLTSTSTVETGKISVYPNPCLDQLYLSLNAPGLYQVLMFDVSGRMVMHQKDQLSELSVLNVSKLPAGSYVLQIISPSNDTVQRVHLQKVN